ncbi:MAG: Arabinose 5-phosphate isomerase KdsD [Gemmatimonadaceae bacterium]|nr:Arabinose 5-phosphate isomerase KdsD [Gemmatimonadaceae bacterium]
MTSEEIIEHGRRVLQLERDALGEIERRLDGEFARAVDLVASSRGRVIVSGVGKSGIVARKIAATLTSTGTPATFLHPVEGLHGDLGIVSRDDVAILLSKSGESEELLVLLQHLKRFGARCIAITGNRRSSLALACDVALDSWVREEACPHDLAPTTSTTTALGLGDALAVVVLEHKGFQREDFARLHPGGSLGRRLLLRVQDLMERDRLPALSPQATMREAIVLLAERRGIVIVRDDDWRLLGVFTAGDLTRLIDKERDFLDIPVARVMTAQPKLAHAEELASAVVYRMEQAGIMAMPVLDTQQSVVGVIHLHDLMRAGVA